MAEFPAIDVGRTLDRKRRFAGPFPAGAPAIFADTVAKLGRSCGFIGAVGNDDFGKLIVRKLREDNVDVSKIRIMDDYTTGTSFVAYSEEGSRKFIFHLRHAAAGQLSPDDVAPSYISKADFLHVAGSTLSINKSSRAAVYKAVEVAGEEGLKVSFDPNVRPELLDTGTIKEVCGPVLEKCHFLLPNEEEIEMLAQGKDPMELLDKGVEVIVVKKGKNGSTLITDAGAIDIPPFSIEEVDPTGAGDSFDAGFVHFLLKGKNPKKAAHFANAAGAISVTGRGGMGKIPTEGEVKEFMKDAETGKRKARPNLN